MLIFREVRRMWGEASNEFQALKEMLLSAIAGSDAKAQSANDALQRLQDASNAANVAMSTQRFETLSNTIQAMDEKLSERLTSLRQLIDLRAELNQAAVGKANEANEKRLESINEFRQTLTDQAGNFITRPVLDARLQQMTTQMDANQQQSRVALDAMTNSIASLNAQLAALTGRVVIGGLGVGIILVTVQLLLNFYQTK